MCIVPALLCAIEWWAVNPVGPEMVLPEAEPRGGEKGGELRLVATPGEMASLSFVLRSDEELRDVALTAKGGLDAAMDPYVVKCWYQAGSAWYGFVADHLRRKLVPELLLHDETLIEVDHRTQDNYVRYVNADGVSRRAWMSFDFDIVDYSHDGQANLDLIADAPVLRPFALEKGRCKQIFVKVRVPKDAKAGLHRGVFELGQPDTRTLLSIPYVLRVLPFALPVAKTSHRGDREFLLCLSGTGAPNEAVARNLVEHGCRTLQGVPRIDPKDPQRFRDEAAMLRKAGLTLKPLVFASRGADIAIKGEEPTDEELAKLEAYRTNVLESVKLVKETLGHDDFYGYAIDEAGADLIRRQRRCWQITHEAGGKVGAAGHPLRELQFELDYLEIPGMPAPWRIEEVRKWHDANPESVCSWYADPHCGPENPDYFRRLHGLLPWHTGYDISGNYTWWRNNWNDMAIPYEPDLRGLVAVYATRDNVIDTLAWEGIREGMLDVRYATLAKELATKALAEKDTAVRRLGRRTLAFIAYWDPFRADPRAFRSECTDFILRLRAAGVALPQPEARPEPPRDVPRTAEAAHSPSDRTAALDAKIKSLSPIIYNYNFNDPKRYPAWRTAVRERLKLPGLNLGYYPQFAKTAFAFDDLGFARELTDAGLAKKPSDKALLDLRARLKALSGDAAGAADDLVASGQPEIADWLRTGRLASGASLETARSVSRWLFNVRRYDDCRAIQAFVRANLLKPTETKVHKVVFDADAPRSAEGFARSKYYGDWDSMETRFEAYGKEYSLRKKVDEQRLAKTAEEPVIDPAYRTGLKVIADAVGVHVFIRGNDPKIDELNLFQRENAGSIECFFEPGDHEKPYRSIFFRDLPGTQDRSCVEWSMPTRGYRASSEAVFKDATLTKEGFVAHVFLPWIAYYDSLPTDGRYWIFGVDRVGPMGDVCTGGLCHGLSHGVRLVFDLSPAQLATLRRRVALSAYNRYRKLRNDKNGFILRWCDPDLGDPAFFAQKVTPLLMALDKAGEELTKPCAEAELDRICRDFVPRWAEIDFELSDLRTAWLTDKVMEE